MGKTVSLLQIQLPVYNIHTKDRRFLCIFKLIDFYGHFVEM